MSTIQTFIFDFDSTIFPGETLDEIIQFKLKGDPAEKQKSQLITEICNLGMSGSISMEESLKRRLDIAAPDMKTISSYIEANVNRINPSFFNLLTALQESGHNVFVVSGGFEEWIAPLMKGVLPSTLIHANKILDKTRPMSFSNIIRRDKELIINQLIERGDLTSTKITIIGDGATDFSVFENKLAQYFIGTFFYAGEENRKRVVEKASQQGQALFNNLDEFVSHMEQFL